MTPDEVTWRRRAGRLTPVHRGVYAVGHPALTDDARMRVALLAAGPNAVASHGTAAAIWALTPALPAVQHVTHPRRSPPTPKR
jgi:hypothetical protein